MKVIDLSSEILTSKDCILEIPEIEYDNNELIKIYESIKDFARVKYLPWKETPDQFISKEESKSLIIQYDNYQIRNPYEQEGMTVNLLDFEYISNLAKRFKIPLYPGNFSITIYKEGYEFKPHIDGYAASVIMFPITGDFSDKTLNFYHRPGMEYETYKEYEMDNSNIFFSHSYNTTNPIIFNSHIVHGVKKLLKPQIKLKINTNHQFGLIRQQYIDGHLIA